MKATTVVILLMMCGILFAQELNDNNEFLYRIIIENNKMNHIIHGTDGHDRLIGGNGIDVIIGYEGNDIINGRNYDDILIGGNGADILMGGGGNDTIYGNGGDDNIDGNIGDDVVFAGIGDDHIETISGNDTIIAGPGDDYINAGQNEDYVDGGNGNDYIWGRWGNDILFGGLGDDILHGASDTNELTGGPGYDYFMIDLFDNRDFFGINIIKDFEVDIDKFYVRGGRDMIDGEIYHYQNDKYKWTEIRAWPLESPQNYQDIIVEGVWVYVKDAEFFN
jgi:Ca2+-binding RTX toxin-like protein